MAEVKALTGLALLGCLILMVNSTPIKGKEETLISRPSKFSRVKTVPRVPESSQSSIAKPWNRPEFRSTTTHVDSSVTPPSVAIQNPDQAPVSQGSKSSASFSVKTFTRGPQNRRTTLSNPWNRRDFQSTTAYVDSSVTPPSVTIHNPVQVTLPQINQNSVPQSVKTFTQVPQNQRPSTSNPWNRADFQSTTAHVGSSVTPPSVAVQNTKQATLSQDNINNGAQSIKTFTQVTQNQRTSFSNRNNRPAFQTTTTRFDSRVTPSLEVVQHTDQATLSQNDQEYDAQPVNGDIPQVSHDQRISEEQKFSVAEHSSSQTVRTPGRHSHLPAITNFGDRVQKNDQDSTISRCRVKGGCPTTGVTPSEQVPVDSVRNVDNSLQPVAQNQQGNTVFSRDQQSIFTESTHTQTGNAFETGQNKDDSQSFPQNGPHSQDEGQFKVSSDVPAPEIDGVHRDQQAIQTDFRPDTQFVTQHDFSDHQNPEPSVGNFPGQQQDFSSHSVGQTFDNNRPNHDEQRRVDAASVFGQTSSRDVFQSSVTNVQRPFDSSANSQGGSSLVTFDDTPQHSDDGQYYHYGDPIEALRYNVPGNPGEDYPILYQVPFTSFDCKNQAFSAGIYGDVEASCQVFHVCKDNGGQDSFLCPNGTVFNQQYFVCDWWYNFRCSDTPSFYSLNADLYWDWDSFTPTDVLNVPPVVNDGSNVQGNLQSNFGSNEHRHSVITGQNNAVQSVGPFGNSGINLENQSGNTQGLQHTSVHQSTVPVTRNDFPNSQHSFHEQSREEHSFTSDFSGTTGRIDSVTAAPVSGSRFPNVQTTSNNQGFTNTRAENNFQTTLSDTGVDYQTGSDAGAQYPDQQVHVQQSNEDFPSQDQFNAEGLVPVSFDDRGSFGNSDYGRTDINQNNFGAGTSIGNELRTNQERPADVRKDVQGITQTQIREEIPSNSFDRDTSQVFNPANQVGDVQSGHGSFTPQNQGSGVFDTNKITQNQQISQNQLPTFDINQQSIIKDDQNSNIGQAHNAQSNHGVSQENIFTNFEDNRPGQSFNGGNFGPQTQVTRDYTSTTYETHGVDNSETFKSTDTPTFHDQQEVHQEHISSSFNDQNTQDIGGVTSGVSHDSSVSSFNEQKDNTGDFTSFDNVSPIADTQNIVGNENLQQDQIPFFGDNRDNSAFDSTGNRRDHFNPQTTVDDNLQISGAGFDSHSNSGNQNTDANQGVQQEHISSIDVINQNRFDFNGNIDLKANDNRDQGQGFSSFQPNTQTFNNEGGYSTQDVGENFAVNQEHVSVPFSGFDVNTGDDRSLNKKRQEEFSNTQNRGNTVFGDNQDVSFVRNTNKNSFQVTEQKHVSDQLGVIQSSLPDINEQRQISHSPSVSSQTFGSEFKGSNSPIGSQSFKQDSKGISSGGNFEQVSVPGSSPSQHQGSSSFSSDGQSISEDKTSGNQQNIGVGIQQTNVPVVFDENRGFQSNANNDGFRQQQFDNGLNQVSGISSNTPHNLGSSNVPSDVNPSQVPELQQHEISSFNVQQSNIFNSDGDDGRQTMQGDYENRQEQYHQFNNFQQSNVRVNSNQQQIFQISQNVRQEHIPTSFNNVNQNNINPGNVPNQVNNQGNFHPQNQFVPTDNQQNILAVHTNEENQNTDVAFQQRLNDFQPADIQRVNQGQVQNIDGQQTLNFRPYGQNNQNTVIFPDGQNRIILVPSHFSGDTATFPNNGGPSNHNFFVTNGHQVLNEQQQQTVRGHSPNQDIQPNNQPDVRHRGAHGPGFFGGDNDYSDAQNARNVQFDEPSPRDYNQNVNSRVKGYSSGSFRNGRSIGQGSSLIAISAGDAVPRHQAVPESPSSMSYNGWKPIIKH